MTGTPIDVRGEDLVAILGHLRQHVVRQSALFQLERVVDPVANRLLVLIRNAEQHPDGPHRHRSTDIGDEVEAALCHQGFETARAEFPHLGFERRDPPGLEDVREQRSMHIVLGRVFEDDRAPWDRHSALDQLEQRALR